MTRPVRRLALAGLLAFLYLYPFPYFAPMRSANELPRIYLTTAMVDEGRFAIDTGVREHGTTVDVSPSSGHHYSNKAPGSSFLAVPAYLLVKAVCALTGAEPSLALKTWAFRVATGIAPTLLFLLLLWRFLARYAPEPAPRRTALAGYAAGSMAMTYSILFVSHQLSAVCIAGAWMLSVQVVEDGRDVRLLALAGFLAGAAPLVDYQAAFAGVPLAAYLVWKLCGRAPRRPAALALTVLCSLPPMALLLFYHWRAFGHPLRTGYAASETFAHFHQRGFLGMDKLRWEALVGSTVAPDNGLLFLCPMLLLALPGFYLLARRRDWWTLGVTASVVAIYILFISSLSFWRGGWQVGPRYITAMLPFAMVPVAVAIAAADKASGWRGELAWAGAVALVATSIAIYSLSSALFPHYPETFLNPVHELVLRLLGEGHAPWNAGWLVGLRGLASLVPYLVAIAGLLALVAVPRRERLRAGVAGLILAAGIVALYGTAPGGGSAAARSYARITTWMPGGP
ncbi:MAG TPA: hypothetical protein VNO33_17345 [Kofleriaceae bacterium]|nr:hypothetical protein [Kofleriaceae bacterium]